MSNTSSESSGSKNINLVKKLKKPTYKGIFKLDEKSFNTNGNIMRTK